MNQGFYNKMPEKIKKSRYWLKLIHLGNSQALEKECQTLIKEVTELMMIFGAIVRKNSFENLVI